MLIQRQNQPRWKGQALDRPVAGPVFVVVGVNAAFKAKTLKPLHTYPWITGFNTEDTERAGFLAALARKDVTSIFMVLLPEEGHRAVQFLGAVRPLWSISNSNARFYRFY